MQAIWIVNVDGSLKKYRASNMISRDDLQAKLNRLFSNRYIEVIRRQGFERV